MVVRELFQVKLIYKSYFHAKWKSKAMQPCSPSSSRASPLHLTYMRRVGGQLAERCVAGEPGVAHTGWSVRITLLPGIYQTCYLIDGEHYYASLTRRVVDPQHVLSDCNLYRIDVDTKVDPLLPFVPVASGIDSPLVLIWRPPQPWLEATKKRGHLIKQGGRIKTWKHRYTTLQHHEIHYFRDDKVPNPRYHHQLCL